jgi:hypothetical protein
MLINDVHVNEALPNSSVPPHRLQRLGQCLSSSFAPTRQILRAILVVWVANLGRHPTPSEPKRERLAPTQRGQRCVDVFNRQVTTKPGQGWFL